MSQQTPSTVISTMLSLWAQTTTTILADGSFTSKFHKHAYKHVYRSTSNSSMRVQYIHPCWRHGFAIPCIDNDNVTYIILDFWQSVKLLDWWHVNVQFTIFCCMVFSTMVESTILNETLCYCMGSAILPVDVQSFELTTWRRWSNFFFSPEAVFAKQLGPTTCMTWTILPRWRTGGQWSRRQVQTTRVG